MTNKDWSHLVFRLREIPSALSNRAEAAELLSAALAIPVNSITIFSLAKTVNLPYEVPSRVATLQLTSVPSCITKAPNRDEWEVPIPNGSHSDVLLLDTHFKGMTALGDADPAKHRADCIAISGLASHPFGSWQPHGRDKTFMWIRDAIPKSDPGIRTITYGYDSGLAGSDSFQTISDIARTLIQQLKAGGWNSPSAKPTIFLAHSLGGLVLKDAIVQMADGERSVAAILDNVLGAIMFGVPSLGMEQSHLLAMVEGEPTEHLVENLSRDGDSGYLARLSEQFEGLAFVRAARIRWAYETKRTPVAVLEDGSWSRNGRSEVLVNRNSATCRRFHGKDKSATIPINQNHSNMVKFTRGDDNIRVIISHIKEICLPRHLPPQHPDMNAGVPMGFDNDLPKGEAAVGDPSQHIARLNLPCEETLRILGKLLHGLDDLHNSLHSPELDFRIGQIDDPFTNTFRWVFELDEFSRWLQTGSGLFWIYGKPGSGKSTLMKYIFRSTETWQLLHNWRTGSLEIKAAFFFHYRGNALQKSFEGVLRSLVTQLLSTHRDAFETRHRSTWEKYESVKKQQKNIVSQYNLCRDKLSSVEKELLNYRQQAERHQNPELQSRVRNLEPQEVRSLEQQEQALKVQLGGIKQEFQQSLGLIPPIAAEFEPHRTSPATMFLTALLADASGDGHGYISNLERVLLRLLEQDIIEMDLILFFDALDEFDGNLALICGFLKDLVRPPTTKSMTRVKVLFSSRPWEQLKEHFSKYPGFALQKHTKPDIVRYAAGKVAKSLVSGDSFAQVLPFVIDKADGVFLWVRLALDVLIEQASSHRGQIPADALTAKLLALPADLFEFYELIIERISSSRRRQTYVLLELLIRHNGPPLTTVQIRDAVLVSESLTYKEAKRVLEADSHRLPSAGTEGYMERVNSDIYSWGGGLVEIGGPSEATENAMDYRPQLMHQTVLEFATGLSFKKTVLGDLTYIIGENGHSFHLKYWCTKTRWAEKNKQLTISMLNDRLSGQSVTPGSRAMQGDLGEMPEDWKALDYLYYHAEQSELTTGQSHFEFLYGMGEDTLWRSFRGQDYDSEFVFLVASCGLSLCLRDWIASKPGELERLMIPKVTPKITHTIGCASLSISYPLLSSLVFAPAPGIYHAGNLTTIRLLFQNGYTPKREPEFFRWMMEETWCNKFGGNLRLIPDESLHEIIRLALDYGANARDSAFGIGILDTNVPLIHITPPQLVEDLIRHGAEPNAFDSRQRTPLDWAIRLPSNLYFGPRDWDLKRRYDTCNLLLRHGGTCNNGEPKLTLGEVNNLLEKFKGEGYDVEFLTARLSEIPGLEGLREYGILGGQFGQDETHPAAEKLKVLRRADTTSATEQAVLRKRRLLNNGFNDSVGLLIPDGAIEREQSLLSQPSQPRRDSWNSTESRDSSRDFDLVQQWHRDLLDVRSGALAPLLHISGQSAHRYFTTRHTDHTDNTITILPASLDIGRLRTNGFESSSHYGADDGVQKQGRKGQRSRDEGSV